MPFRNDKKPKKQKDLLLIVHFAHLHSHVGVIARLKCDIKDAGEGPNTWNHPASFAASASSGKCKFVPVSRPVTQRDDSEARQTAHSAGRRFHVTLGVMEVGPVTPQACAADSQRL